MNLVIYWTIIINSTKDGVINTTIDFILSQLGNKSLSITKSEVYWKDKTKHQIELKQSIELIPSIDLVKVKLIDTIEKISSNWNINIVSLSHQNFDVSATTENLPKNEIHWVGFSAEIN